MVVKNLINRILNILYSYICIYTKLKKHGKHIRINRKTYCINGLQHITIDDNFYGANGLWLDAIDNYHGYTYHPEISIGRNVSIGRNSHIGSINKISIGNDVMMGSNILIEDHSHGNTFDYSKLRRDLPLVSNGEIVIGDNTWICDNAVILGGARIGKNCVVAANSVVNNEFPDNCLIGGIPARILKKIRLIIKNIKLLY